MNKAGTIKFEENWKFVLKDKYSGKILREEEVTNLITNAWKNIIRDWMYDGSGDHPVALAIGTGTTSPVVGDTTLETEFTRQTATASKPDSYQVKYAKEFTFGSGTSESITEAGLFDSITVSGSSMTARTTFTAIAITESTSLAVEATITIAGS